MEDHSAARKQVQAITVDAPRTYHMAGYGAASSRHKNATEWTPWNDPAAQDGRSLSGREADNPDTAVPAT